MEMGKLIELQINDLKTIDLVELTLNEKGELVELIGDNGVGKSTVIEGIESLFNGGALPPGLVRDGKTEAIIEGKFSEGYRVKRRIRKNTKGMQVASLEVFRPDGAKISAPQAVLKEVFESFAAPAQIANSTGVSLYDAVVPLLPIDIEKYTGGIESAQRALTEANAVVKAQGQKDKPSDPKPDVPPFDQAYYDRRADELADARALDAKRDMLVADAEQIKRRIKELQLMLASAEENIETIGKPDCDALEVEVANMKEARDKRAHAEHLLHEWDVYEDWFAGMNSASKTAVFAKDTLVNLRSERSAAIAKAVAPGGVTVDEERNVFVDGVIWKNCAFSERLKAAILMQLAGIPEGKLKLVFIEHGESMNRIKRQEVAKAAIEQGATVFMEIFSEDVKELTIKSQTAVDPSWVAPAKKTVGIPPVAPDEPVQFDPFKDELGQPEVSFGIEIKDPAIIERLKNNTTPEPDFDDGLDIF